jgi:hypothetical protein
MAIHVALLTAVQPQPAVAVTVTLPLVPPAATDWLIGAMAKVHATPDCITVNAWPPIVTVPVRDNVVAFDATE